MRSSWEHYESIVQASHPRSIIRASWDYHGIISGVLWDYHRHYHEDFKGRRPLYKSLRDVLGCHQMTWGYHGNIIVISWGYYGDIMGIWWWYHDDIMEMPLGYHGDTIGIPCGYHITRISWEYQGDIMEISRGYQGGISWKFHGEIILGISGV